MIIPIGSKLVFGQKVGNVIQEILIVAWIQGGCWWNAWLNLGKGVELVGASLDVKKSEMIKSVFVEELWLAWGAMKFDIWRNWRCIDGSSSDSMKWLPEIMESSGVSTVVSRRLGGRVEPWYWWGSKVIKSAAKTSGLMSIISGDVPGSKLMVECCSGYEGGGLWYTSDIMLPLVSDKISSDWLKCTLKSLESVLKISLLVEARFVSSSSNNVNVDLLSLFTSSRNSVVLLVEASSIIAVTDFVFGSGFFLPFFPAWLWLFFICRTKWSFLPKRWGQYWQRKSRFPVWTTRCLLTSLPVKKLLSHWSHRYLRSACVFTVLEPAWFFKCVTTSSLVAKILPQIVHSRLPSSAACKATCLR